MLTRRQLIGVLGAVTCVGRPGNTREAIRTISAQDHLYHGWPTVARLRSGDLALVWSGGREAHVCPFGRVEFMLSSDEGQPWSWPKVIMDGDLDDRDAGIVETGRGTLLVSTFTSLAYEQRLRDADGWPSAKRERWQAVQK